MKKKKKKKKKKLLVFVEVHLDYLQDFLQVTSLSQETNTLLMLATCSSYSSARNTGARCSESLPVERR